MQCCSDLLHLLSKAGVGATTEGGRLVLRPAARVPRELVTDILRYRDEIVALLNGAVILGPWRPTTPDELAEERRRVMEEEPRRWWCQPRYRVAELERSGMDRARAVATVREEVARTGNTIASVDNRQHADDVSGTDAE